jgi:hypothetical protein
MLSLSIPIILLFATLVLIVFTRINFLIIDIFLIFKITFLIDNVDQILIEKIVVFPAFQLIFSLSVS